VSTQIWPLARLAFALLLTASISGCSSDDESFRLRLLTVPSAAPFCSGPLNASSISSELPAGRYTLRVMFIAPQTETVNARSQRRFELGCFRTLEPGEKSELLLPQTVGPGKYSVFVEAFAPDKTLAYSGMARDVDLAAASADVLLQPAAAQTCDYDMRRFRAFHSSTLLPNGQVLLIGGLNGSRSATGSGELGEQLYATNGVEVYDPATLRFSIVSSDAPKLLRAFHRAVLLPSPAAGPYKVLVVGGAMATNPSEPLVARRNPVDLTGKVTFACTDSSDCSYHATYLPHEKATAGEAAIVEYSPAEKRIEYRALSGIESGFFPSLVLDSSGNFALLVAGADGYDISSNAQQGFTATSRNAQWIDLAATARDETGAASSLSLTHLRAGHAVARLGGGNYLLLGGNMDGDDAQLSANLALFGTSSGLSAITATADVEPSAYHTLTSIGVGDKQLANDPTAPLLWAGGFVLATNAKPTYRFARAGGDRQAAVAVIDANSTTVSQKQPLTVTLPKIGYHDAHRLHDGSVLVTGGNHQSNTCELPGASCSSDADCGGARCAPDNRCPGAKTSTILCATRQLALFTMQGAQVVLDSRGGFPTELKHRRYGHQVTRLLDNALLVTGGVAIDPQGRPEIHTKAEILNPHRHRSSEALPIWVEKEGAELSGSSLLTNESDNACSLRN
jgi:hypothetical protein